jgi:hypothetical protein
MCYFAAVHALPPMKGEDIFYAPEDLLYTCAGVGYPSPCVSQHQSFTIHQKIDGGPQETKAETRGGSSWN